MTSRPNGSGNIPVRGSFPQN